jgi:hypothetical protein
MSFAAAAAVHAMAAICSRFGAAGSALILRQFLPGHFRHDFPLHFQRNRNLSGQLFRITELLSTSVLTISLPWFQSVSGPHRESLDYWDLDPRGN